MRIWTWKWFYGIRHHLAGSCWSSMYNCVAPPDSNFFKVRGNFSLLICQTRASSPGLWASLLVTVRWNLGHQEMMSSYRVSDSPFFHPRTMSATFECIWTALALCRSWNLFKWLDCPGSPSRHGSFGRVGAYYFPRWLYQFDPTNSVWGLPFLCIIANICCLLSFRY